jgi:hypothetical protein
LWRSPTQSPARKVNRPGRARPGRDNQPAAARRSRILPKLHSRDDREREAFFLAGVALNADFAMRSPDENRLDLLPPPAMPGAIREPMLTALFAHPLEILRLLEFFDLPPQQGIVWSLPDRGRPQ